MINFEKPETETRTPKALNDIISIGSKVLYFIECIFQRPFVWDVALIEKWFNEFFCVCIENFNSVSYDGAYQIMGEITTSDLEDCNEKYLDEETKKVKGVSFRSIVDGSQRLRLVLMTYLAFLLWKSKENGSEYIDTRCIQTSFGAYKISEIGEDDFSNFYKFIENTSIKDILSDKNRETREQMEKKFSKENEKRELRDIFYYMVRIIEDAIINNDDCVYKNMEMYIQVLLHNCYVLEESVTKDKKMAIFEDKNAKGTPMSMEDLYPKILINNENFEEDKEEIYSAYKRFEKEAHRCTETNTYTETKNHVGSLLFIMQEALKIVLGKMGYDKPFKSDFQINDRDYGFEKCLSKKIYFRTKDEVIEYFKLCEEIAVWITEESMRKHENVMDDTYIFKGTKKSKNTMWWYCVKPCFIMYKYLSEEERRYAIDFLFKTVYIPYCVLKVAFSDSNVQNFINNCEKMSFILLQHENETFEETKCKLKKLTQKTLERYNIDTKVVKSQVMHLMYTSTAQYGAIEKILLCLERELITRFDLPSQQFYESFVYPKKNENKQSIEKKYALDHCLPKNNFGSDGDTVDTLTGNSIGNLVLLEEGLNSSKQDNTEKSYDYYQQSGYNTTKLLCDGYKNLTPKVKEELEKYPFFKRYDKENINNPSKDMIEERTSTLADFIIDYMYSPFKK